MTKITQLDALTTQAAGDLIAIVDDVGGSPETKKITITNLFQGIPVDVGIGTTTPTAELELSASFPRLYFNREANAAATGTGIYWRSTADVVEGILVRRNDTGDFWWYTNADGSNPRFALTDAGLIGIGTTAPDGTLHVHTGTAGAVTAHASADEIVAENSANAGMSILTPNDATGAIYFGDEDDNNAGRILYVHSTPFMRLIVEATEVIDFLETEIQARFPIKIKESAAAVADTAIYGQLWVKNTDPNELWFTDGDGQDNQVAYVV